MFFRFRSSVMRCLQSGNQTGRMNDLRGRYPVVTRRARMSASEIGRRACLRPTWGNLDPCQPAADWQLTYSATDEEQAVARVIAK